MGVSNSLPARWVASTRTRIGINFFFDIKNTQEGCLGKMSLLKIECLVNPMKETKLATDEKVKSVRLLHSRSPKAKHATSNGICLNEDYSKEGWKRQNKVNMVGEDEGLIRLEKLRPVPPPTPMQPIIPFPDGDEEEEDEGGSISVAMLHPMRIDSGFLCKHRTEGRMGIRVSEGTQTTSEKSDGLPLPPTFEEERTTFDILKNEAESAGNLVDIFGLEKMGRWTTEDFEAIFYPQIPCWTCAFCFITVEQMSLEERRQDTQSLAPLH